MTAHVLVITEDEAWKSCPTLGPPARAWRASGNLSAIWETPQGPLTCFCSLDPPLFAAGQGATVRVQSTTPQGVFPAKLSAI